MLCGARKSIQEPMGYELIRGRLADAGVTVEVQEREIKKIKKHFSWAPATCPDDEKIDLFVGLVKFAKALDPQRIQISEYSYTDDSISYGTFDSTVLDALTERCAVYFLPDELASLRRFVDTPWRFRCHDPSPAPSINHRTVCLIVGCFSL